MINHAETFEFLQSPEFLAIGHVTKDLTDDGYILGGTVAYSALTAQALGLDAKILTSSSQDVDPGAILADIPVCVVPSEKTTTMANMYVDGRRSQVLRNVAGKIRGTDIPELWRKAPLVLLGPLAAELDESIPQFLDSEIIVASLQGWLRQWDEFGNVSPSEWEGLTLLPQVDAAIFSDDDNPSESQISRWITLCRTVIHTHGGDGYSIYHEGEWHHFSAFEVNEVDPTGAGDVFATAFLIRFREVKDPVDAAIYASCAASFCVEEVGVTGIPTRKKIQERLKISNY